MKTSRSSSNVNMKRPESATLRGGSLSKNMQNRKEGLVIPTGKREKLKSLLFQKFLKQFPTLGNDFVLNKVTEFIKAEKLTENDLKSFEEKLKNWSQSKTEESKVKNFLEEDQFKTSKPQSLYSNSKLNDNDAISQHSMTNLSLISARNETKGLKYEDITNFELRKLLKDEKQPLVKEKISKFNDEWTAIADYKNKQWEQQQNENKIKNNFRKSQTRTNYDNQIKEKNEMKANLEKAENNYHRVLMFNLDQETKSENKKLIETKEKKVIVKGMQDSQVRDNIDRKKNDFISNREFDEKIIQKIYNDNEKAKREEKRKKEEAQESLRQMLRENEEFKKKQQVENRKEREQDIKFMEEYTRILDKQEQDRADYFKKCESRQMDFMNRMAETVIKQHDDKLKADEEKMLKFQIEKNKRDQEEEDRRKRYLKDTKVNMRHYLTNQMIEKKRQGLTDKQIQDEQLRLWNEENYRYFEKEKDTNERVKQMNKSYAEFLKSQFKSKNSQNGQMNEEEYRLNKDILEEVQLTPSTTRKNFLI